jgi:hypothetical protein
MIAVSDQPDVRQVGVVLIGCTGVLGDLIRAALSADPGVRVLLELSGSSGHRLTAAINRLRPDVVVCQLEDDRKLAGRTQFFGVPAPCSVVTVLDDGANGSVWRLRPERQALGALSPRTLVAAVHQAAVWP